jgi:hypothetical protein
MVMRQAVLHINSGKIVLFFLPKGDQGAEKYQEKYGKPLTHMGVLPVMCGRLVI